MRAARSARYVVASGSLPPGVPRGFYQTLAEQISRAGCRFVLDVSGEPLRRIGHGVFLMKPSARELAECVGRPLPDRDSQLAAARELITCGVAELVVVSLGADGALAVGADWWEALPATPVSVASAIGAGDAMVAGIVVGFLRELSPTEAMELGVAAASVALVTTGTGPGHPDVIAELLKTRNPPISASRQA